MAFKYFFVLSIAIPIFAITLGEDLNEIRKASVNYAVYQYRRVLSNLTVGRYITETSPLNSIWPTVGADEMKAGYLPGILWNIYRYTNDPYWRQVAMDFIDPLANLTTFNNTENYAISFGTAYDITGNESYANTIIRAADSIISGKYNASLGFIVEIRDEMDGTCMSDTYNLVELECVVRAWKLTGNQSYYDIAVNVLDNALKTFVRTNHTTFSNVQFNLMTGNITQIYTTNSPLGSWGWWSRGHMWLIVGLVDVYRETQIERFLTAAQNLAIVYIDNLPDDYITFNDFYTAYLPGYYVRDTASASIAASYFPQIASYTTNSTLKELLLSTATSIFRSLWSNKYLAIGNPLYNLPALLANATHNIPDQQDYSFSIADYYFSKSIQYVVESSAIKLYFQCNLICITLLYSVIYFITNLQLNS